MLIASYSGIVYLKRDKSFHIVKRVSVSHWEVDEISIDNRDLWAFEDLCNITILHAFDWSCSVFLAVFLAGSNIWS